MNTKNNKRRQSSQNKIEKTFIELLQTKEIEQISVSDICSRCQLNRSTFYANYLDVYDLADKIRDKLEQDVADLFTPSESSIYSYGDWVKLFYHIKENPLFYKTYFKLGYDQNHIALISDREANYPELNQKHIEYRMEFFRAGFNAIVKKWLAGGCKETPEEMNEILVSEYSRR